MSKDICVAIITKKFQIVVPKKIREFLKLKSGDYIAFIIEGNEVKIKKAEVIRDIKIKD